MLYQKCFTAFIVAISLFSCSVFYTSVFAQRMGYRDLPVQVAQQVTVDIRANEQVKFPVGWQEGRPLSVLQTLEDGYILGNNFQGDVEHGQVYVLETALKISGVQVGVHVRGAMKGEVRVKVRQFGRLPGRVLGEEVWNLDSLSDGVHWKQLLFSKAIVYRGPIIISLDVSGVESGYIGLLSQQTSTDRIWTKTLDRKWQTQETLWKKPAVVAAIWPVVQLGADFAGGSGTREDPYQVATAEQLNVVRDYLSAHFIQVEDIDLDQDPRSAGEGWLPIGRETPFTGTYNGAGHSISGLYIDRPDSDYQGLFGRLVSARVWDLELSDATVVGKDFVGIVAGQSLGGFIERIKVSGSVKGKAEVGGITGIIQEGWIRGGESDVAVVGQQRVGGIAGHGQCEDCLSRGFVRGESGSFRVGGLLGQGHAMNSRSEANVTGGSEVGGLIGRGTAFGCQAIGTVDGTGDYIGGLIGDLTDALFDSPDGEYNSGDIMPSDTNKLRKIIELPGNGMVVVVLEDGTRIAFEGNGEPVEAIAERLPLPANIDDLLPPMNGLRFTGSARRLLIEGSGEPENIKPIVSIPIMEIGTINPVTINVLRVGKTMVDGELIENLTLLLPILEVDDNSLKFVDGYFPESLEIRNDYNGDNNRADQKRFVGEVNYYLLTFDQSLNWSKRPELVRMIPDRNLKEKGYRSPLSSLEAERKNEIQLQPICNVVILVHGHNEEEKDGYVGNRIEAPWDFTYKRLVWELLHEEFAENGDEVFPKECTAIYEFISPTYRPIFSPVPDKGGYSHITLGEDLGRLVNQEFERNPQLKAMIEADLPFNLFFVAHSQGGLILRAGLRFVDEKLLKRTKRAITWGSPHTGAALYSLRYALAVGHDIVIDGYKFPMQNIGQSQAYQSFVGSQALDAPGIRDMRWDASKKQILRLGELLKENTTTLNEFKDSELPNGRMFYSDNLALFNENEGRFQLGLLANKYLFYEGKTPKIAELEFDYIYVFFKNYWKYKQGATLIEKGAQANQLTLHANFKESDGAVPTYSQRGAGIWPSGNIQRRVLDDIDHEEFYGAEAPQRDENTKAKGRLVLKHTLDDMELDKESRWCPWIELSKYPQNDSTLYEGQFNFPIFETVNGGNGKPGLWVDRIEFRKDSLKGELFSSVSFEIFEDGRFRLIGKTSEFPASESYITLVLKDGSIVFIKSDEAESPVVWNKTLNKWYLGIQAAVDGARDNDEILVYPGIYYDPVSVDKTITIRGVGGADETILDGSNRPNFSAMVMNSCSPIIDGFTFRNWRKGIGIGGVFGTFPEIINNVIESNEWGGVQVLGGASIKLINNKILGNNWHGVEILTGVEGETSIIEDNLIYNNFNGLIAERKASLIIRKNHFLENLTSGDAIRLWDDAKAEITENIIERNSRGISANRNSSVEIKNNIIRHNSGSGIGISDNAFGTIISENEVHNNGWGIGGQNITITKNNVYDNGTGISAGSMTIIHDNIVLNNHEDGIYISTFSQPILDVTITNNEVNGNGRGIYIAANNVTIRNNTIVNSIANSGVYASGQEILIENNTIQGNRGFNGGGVSISGSDVVLRGNTINNNQSSTDGGGVYASSGTIENNTIVGNSAVNGGGIYLSGQNTSLSGNVISNNYANNKGGGVYGAAQGWQRFETVIVGGAPRQVKRHVPCFLETANTYSGNSHGVIEGEWGPGTDSWCPDAGFNVYSN
jgi:hypothetical protein